MTTILPDHVGVLDAAVLAAEEVERAGPVGLEPVGRVARREDVHVDAEGRDEEVVDDVLGDHLQLHGLSEGDVQLVDLPRPVRMLHLPHPLLSGDPVLHGVVGRTHLVEEDPGAPPEEDEEEPERDRGPGELEHLRGEGVVVDRDTDLVRMAAPVLRAEKRR